MKGSVGLEEVLSTIFKEGYLVLIKETALERADF